MNNMNKITPITTPNAGPVAGPNVPAVTPVAAVTSVPVIAEPCFDHHLNKFWFKMPSGIWIKLDKRDAFPHMGRWIPNLPADPKERKALIYEALVLTQEYSSVDFAGALAGYKEGLLVQGDKRILVTSSPKFIAPVPGNWDMLRGILENMFGNEQLLYVYGWIKIALAMFAAQSWMAGQALVLCGPKDAGKNLFGLLLQHLFGGRAPGKPYDYMTQRTSFNSEFMGCELLTIEDEASLTDIQTRRMFGAEIKKLAVNTSRRLHQKHVVAMTVEPLQRLLISLNDQPERLLVLPPIEDDIVDKIMLFKVETHPMPMPTHTPEAMLAFRTALLAQLPAFVDFLQNWQIPADLVSNRFGIRYYHHPEILEGLHELSPEEKLLQLIDEVIFAPGLIKTDWHGRAVELDRALKNAESRNVQREAEKLLPSVASCGKYLGRLATRHPDRVTRHPGSSGIHNWTIKAPLFSVGKCRSAPSPELMAKIRGVNQAAPPKDDKLSAAPAVEAPQLEVKIKSVRIKGEATQDDQPEDGNNPNLPPVTGPVPILASISSGAEPEGIPDLRSRVRMAEVRFTADRDEEIRCPSLN